jgi:hypothetical protein
MKKHLLKLSILALCAGAVLAAPAWSVAQDTATGATAAKTTAPKRHRQILPFHGKLDAVDTNAMTFTVGKRTFQVTSETKILKDGQPAVLADGVVGERVSGSYRKTADGKLEAVRVHFGIKPGGKKPTAASKGN